MRLHRKNLLAINLRRSFFHPWMTVNKKETRRIKHNGFKGGLIEELEASDIPANTHNLCYVCITI